jgi:hypothetical protein
VSAEVERLRA